MLKSQQVQEIKRVMVLSSAQLVSMLSEKFHKFITHTSQTYMYFNIQSGHDYMVEMAMFNVKTKHLILSVQANF